MSFDQNGYDEGRLKGQEVGMRKEVLIAAFRMMDGWKVYVVFENQMYAVRTWSMGFGFSEGKSENGVEGQWKTWGKSRCLVAAVTCFLSLCGSSLWLLRFRSATARLHRTRHVNAR